MSSANEDNTGAIVGPKRHLARLPGQVVKCGWCGAWVAVPARGRVPKWCSATCRHRAWEQNRAAASGLAAVEVVEHVIERPVRVEVHVAAPPPPAPPPSPAPPFPKNAKDWAAQLTQLGLVLDSGVINRDLPTIEVALERLIRAYNRRSHPRP